MFKIPQHTQIPNILFDELLKDLKEGELRVLMVIMRQTFGWHKTWDVISISQLAKKTGMEKKSVHRSLQTLVEKKMIRRVKQGLNGFQKTYYSLCLEEENQETNSVEDTPYSNNLDQCPKDTPPSVLKTPTKETTLTCKEEETRAREEKEKKKPERIKRGDFVYLTDPEYQELIKLYGVELVEKKILDMDCWCSENRTTPFKNCYLQLKKWCIKEKGEPKQEPRQKSRQEPKKNLASKDMLSNRTPELLAKGKEFINNLITKNAFIKEFISISDKECIVYTPLGEKRGSLDDKFYIELLKANLESWFKKKIIL